MNTRLKLAKQAGCPCRPIKPADYKMINLLLAYWALANYSTRGSRFANSWR